MSEQDIQKYEKILEEDPQSRAFAPLAEAYRKIGNLDDAIRVAEAGLEVHPGYTGGLVVLGRAFYEKKELDKAADILKKAVAEAPDSYLGQKFLGKVMMEKGENEAALRALEVANMQSPDDAEIIELLEKVRPKAQPPEAMAFSDAAAQDATEEADIVTYEQKPTTVDGVELEPLTISVDEENFTFSDNQDDVFLPAEPLEEAGRTAEKQDIMDDLGPEAAQFIQEADIAEDAVFNVPENGIDQDDEPPEIEDLIEEITPDAVTVQPETEVGYALEDVPEVDPGPVKPSTDVESTSGAAEPYLDPEPEARVQPSSGMEHERVILNMEEEPPDSVHDVSTTQNEIPGVELENKSDDRSASAGDISTETLADLYANQGLTEKAAEIYRQILLEKPTDEGVAAKLKNLEQKSASLPTDSVRTESEPPANSMSPADSDDVLNILENWLQNSERMKQK